MLKFSDGSHCHWTYTIGNYRSFLSWPTREDLVEAYKHDDAQITIIQVHADTCDSEVEHG